MSKTFLRHTLIKKIFLIFLFFTTYLYTFSLCDVWHNCGVSNSCKLKRLQLEAARVITGLPIFTNTEYLYRETGWERLEERRTRRKFQLLYNIQNGIYSILFHQQSKVRLFIPFEMATILLFHSVDYL